MDPRSRSARITTIAALLAAGFAGGWGAREMAGRSSATAWPDAGPAGEHFVEVGRQSALGRRGLHPGQLGGDVDLYGVEAGPDQTLASGAMDPGLMVELVTSSPVPLDERVALFGGNDPVARALAIGEGERRQLEDIWRTVRERIEALQLDTLEVEEREDALWIGSAGFDGEELRGWFESRVDEVVGEERGRALRHVMRADHAFGQWGDSPSLGRSLEYVVRDDGSLLYRITERAAPDAPAGRTWITAEMPVHLRSAAAKLGLSLSAAD